MTTSVLKVLVCVQDAPPEIGAGPARFQEMGRVWRDNGCAITVLTAMPSRRIPGQDDGHAPAKYRGRLFLAETLDGVLYLRSWLFVSPRRGFLRTFINNATFAVTAFLNALRLKLEPDVMIVSGPPYLVMLTATAWANIRGVACIVDVRDLWPDYLAEMRMLPAPLLAALFASERWLFRRASAITVVSESTRARLIEKGVAPAKVYVFANGAIVNRTSPLPITPPDTKKRELRLGYAGTIGLGQGLAAVVEALTLAERDGVRAVLRIAGDGSERDRIAQLAARGAPVILSPPIPRDGILEFYRDCDALVIPHADLSILAETIPSKLLEVLAHARPVIAALGGEGAQIVRVSGAGVLARPGDSASIAAAIVQFAALTDVDRSQMGNAGADFVERYYNRNTIADDYLRLIRHVSRGSRL